jgi:hypothetical protein
MDEAFDARDFPALQKDDAGLMTEIEALLTARAVGDPYTADGSFAASLTALPPGLRAMAATHWLDISLTPRQHYLALRQLRRAASGG